MQIVHILAARPNFIKAAPLISELDNRGHNNIIIHTNQHYDYKMSEIFFNNLHIPAPDYHLGIQSGTHGEQTGYGIIEIEKVLKDVTPQLVIVYGDVNSTLSGAIAAVKLHIPIYHIESGCRSGDMTMPEEVNRIMIDSISTKLFCTELSAYNNVRNQDAYVVGNTAIDTLHSIQYNLNNIPGNYYLCTLHRPFNVDDVNRLEKILERLNRLDELVIVPAHPRLEKNIRYKTKYNNIKFIEPLGYIDFISYINSSKGVITDSGGVQCESAFLRKPLLTLRDSTEHIITLSFGNTLCDINDINKNTFKIDTDKPLPKIWDGNASKRIADILDESFSNRSSRFNWQSFM